jgi:signal peptide peptidase SppA, 67K type
MNDSNVKTKKPETKARKFWRIVFGSMLGFFFSTILVSCLYFFMMIGMIAGIAKSADDTTVVKDNSILKIDFSQPIQERAIDVPFGDMYGYASPIGLDKILSAIKSAATDPKIKGIYLASASVAASPATSKEIHDALLDFKKSGKFIYAYADSYSQNGYYIASVADKVMMNPTGNMLLKGYATQVMFYKGLLDKLDIDVQVIRHGQFKSAVEPYILDKMSEANTKQMTALVNSLWDNYSGDVSKSRKIPVEELNRIADNLLAFSPDSAVKLKLIDQLVYAGDVEKMLKSKTGVAEDGKLNFVSVGKYVKSVRDDNKSKNKIAVVYAVGEISDGKGDSERGIFSDTFIKDFRKAYQDKDVKAIVLRVNSPGGSALASEVIWHEIEQAKKAGKKIVTSMGDYAASGGYYISCNSDYIMAQPNTLTGSIGVFGMIPSVQKALKNKLGITVDGVGSNEHAGFLGSISRPLDPMELNVMQQMVEETYGLFTQRVANGRKMTVAAVDSIGQGRVWSGKDAIGIGLVDELGSLDDAIAKAAKLANVSDYKVAYYPHQKSFFEMLFNKEDEADQMIHAKLGDLYYMYQGVQTVLNSTGVQARMPMEIHIQ